MSTTQKKYRHPHLAEALQRLEQEESVRLDLPEDGYLFIDRPLPYLCVYRLPSQGQDHIRFQLDRTEASSLVVPGQFTAEHQEVLSAVAECMSKRFGAFLLLEIWTSDFTESTTNQPEVRLYGPAQQIPGTLEGFCDALTTVKFTTGPLQVEQIDSNYRCPPGMRPLLTREERKQHGILLLGLEIKPFFLNTATGQPYPIYLRSFRNQFSKALKQAFFNFIRQQTNYEVVHFHKLGTTTVDPKVWEVDQQIVDLADQFRFLWLVTPTNIQEARQQFEDSGFSDEPVFHYRLMPVDPECVKRDLYNIRIEDVEDPTLAYFFRDKREELVRMLNMLDDRGTPDFLYSSLQVFGGVDDELLDIARGLLTAIPVPTVDPEASYVDARSFAARAQEEFDYFRTQHPELDASVEVRDDVAGIMVSQGTLYISNEYRVRQDRVEALIQHEVGTHVLTYWNGKAQPLRQLYSGVPGYESLQEGLAVLSEYLVGGLTNGRLRLLAARVVAVRMLIEGAAFAETFGQLVHKYRFKHKQAFNVTMRVYRGGGLTKDAVYLRGLIELLSYLADGNSLEPLLIGKIRPDYIPFLQELIARGILRNMPLLPRYLASPDANHQLRLNRLHAGANVFSFINHNQ